MNYTYPKVWSLVLVLLFVSTVLHSQKIILQGTIIDSTVSQPVSFANIAIGYNRGTISDENGNFRLPIELDDINDTLHITCIGFTDNKIPVRLLALYEQNTIYLSPYIYKLNNVIVKGKSQRIPRSRRIIQEALTQLDSIFYIDTIVYEGYYREYIKDDNIYLNLFEGIINLEEFRNDSLSGFLTELIYKRRNDDFQVDQALVKAYDNNEKFVPFSTVHMNKNNELAFLRLADPLKNIFSQTVSYIDNIQEDLIQHHRFSKPQLTYLNERPYYYITFVDNQNFKQGTNKVVFEGKMFVDAENRGIKKISYLAKLDKGHLKQKLYELNVEYKFVNGKYILNYVSFNNLFMILDFLFKDAKPANGKLLLEFSRNVDTTLTIPENFNINYKGTQQDIELIEITGNKVFVTFHQNNELAKDLNRLERLFDISSHERNVELEHQVISLLNIEFKGIFDEFQNPLSNKKYSDYYQYREFFVHQTKDEKVVPGRFNFSLPVFKNEVISENSNIDTSWLNTPLIDENTEFKLELSEHKLFNTFINQKSILDIKTKNEMVYLHLDREVYAPEDTIWFKGYIRNKAELIPSDLSKSFFIKLVDSDGTIKWEDKFLIEDATVKGQIPIDYELEEGMYYVNGYSSWMENFEPKYSFTKKILIQKEKRSNVQLMVAYDKDEYFPGDTMNLQLTCVDGYNRKIDDVRFRFKINDGKEIIYKGNGKTDIEEESSFQVVLPEKFDTLPLIETFANHEGLGYTKSYPMPINYFLEINFSPEGGHLINGLNSNVAFKAESLYGSPIDVEGEIINEKGEVLQQVKTEHDGMGIFSLIPQLNESYFFRLKSPGGFKGTYNLPVAKDTGMLLSVSEKNNRLITKIETQNLKNDTVLLTVMVRGKLVFYKAFNSQKTKMVRIPTEEIPPGIAVFTLFDNDLLPRAERLLFVKGDNEIFAKISTDRESYRPRDSVIMQIQIESDVDFTNNGSYSLSVVDNEMCSTEQIDEPGIVSYLLMSPEIKGKINNPNYYFDYNNEAAPKHLDLLMLTQGWRNYKLLKSEVLEEPAIIPVNMESISGSITKQPFGREKEPTAGSISVLFGGTTTRIPIKDDGKFSFKPEYDMQHNSGVSIFAEDNKGNPNVSITLDESLFESGFQGYLKQLTDSLNKTIKPLNFTYNRFDEHFTYSLKNHYWIDEVIISKTVSERELTTIDLIESKRVVPKDEIKTYNSLESLVEYYSYYFRYSSKIFFVIDGALQTKTKVEMVENGPGESQVFSTQIPDYSYVRGIFPEDIEEVAIVRENMALYGLYNSGMPDENDVFANEGSLEDMPVIIDIKLKPFSERRSKNLPIFKMSIPKFAVAKEFYSPVYNTEYKRNSQLPDLRKTIFWDNDVKFNKDGIARIKFYNGDRYTRIKCILEGIDDSGIPVRSEYMYRVDYSLN